MDSILNDGFDCFNPKPQRGDYYAKVTRLLSGGVEVVMKTVRPMAQAKMAEQWENHYPVSLAPKPEKSASEIEAIKRDNQRRAVNRASQTARFLCQQMQADRLFTLTYRANVEDRVVVQRDFKQFLKYVRYGLKGVPGGTGGLSNWRYVAVLERQERGAYHIHCAVQGWQPITFLRQCWYKALGAAPDATGSDTPGQVDITPPRYSTGASRKRQWATDRLASYIVKYMSKTFDETTTEKNRYWRARDIEKPEPYRHWLISTSMGSAIVELDEFLKLAEGVTIKKHWLSPDGMTYWMRGVCDAP